MIWATYIVHVIAEILEYGDTFKNLSDGATSTSSQTIKRVVNKPKVLPD